MNNKTSGILTAALLLLTGCQKKWEYQVCEMSAWSGDTSEHHRNETTRVLNGDVYGADGWELVSVAPQIKNGVTTGHVFVFKRPAQ